MEILYLVLAIVIIIALVAVFFISYHFNKKTPLPEGCEDLIDDENCAACGNLECSIKNHLSDELKKASEELKEEE